MPKKPNTPQITTPAPRSLKEAWDKECVRLKWTDLNLTWNDHALTLRAILGTHRRFLGLAGTTTLPPPVRAIQSYAA